MAALFFGEEGGREGGREDEGGRAGDSRCVDL